jgi:hypothetical protein
VNSKYCAFLNLVYIMLSLPFMGMFDIPLPFMGMFDIPLPFIGMLDIPLPLIGMDGMDGMAVIPSIDPMVVLSKLLYPLGA